jgi:hypothetical protein
MNGPRKNSAAEQSAERLNRNKDSARLELQPFSKKTNQSYGEESLSISTAEAWC